MKRRCRLLAAWIGTAVLAGACSGGGGGDDRVDFQTFVRQQITSNTNDTAEPVDVNAIEFRGLNAGDPSVFADLFEQK